MSTKNDLYCLYGGKVDPLTGEDGDYTPGLYAITAATRACHLTDAGKLYADGSSDYYFILSGGAFDVTKTAADGSVFRLFEEVDGSGTEPPVGPGYALADDINSGDSYVVVAKSGGKAYALTTGEGTEEDTLVGAQVTVSGDTVLAADVTDAMKWLFIEDGDGFNVTNGINFLNRRSGGGLYLSETEGASGYSDWIYDSSNRLYTYNNSVENFIYLSSDGSPRFFSTDDAEDNNVTIYLYKIPGTPVESVAVTGLDAPVSGAAPDTDAATDFGTVDSVSWTPEVSDKFAGLTEYTVHVTLTPSGGYTFTSETTAILNGQEVTPVLNTDGTLTVSKTFAPTGAAR
jgi:hypothetical protein